MKPKLKKPSPNFPLTPHPSGRWCKKIRGKLHYFGRDRDAALAKYLDEKDDLQAGRTPRRASTTGLTTEYIVEQYLNRAEMRVAAGDLSPRSLTDYTDVGRLMTRHLGKGSDPEQLQPDDFTRFRFALKYAPSRVSKIITVTRGIFKWAYDNAHMEKVPRFGSDFKVAKKKDVRKNKSERGKKLFTAAQIQALIAAANDQWKAILYLCINGGLGNTDIASLKVGDVGSAWLDFPRPKTGIERRIPLWPETQAAIAVVAKGRDPEELLFLSKHGGPLVDIEVKTVVVDGKEKTQIKRTDLTCEWFRRIAKDAKIYRKGSRMGLYWLRHTFQTIANGAIDPQATSRVMGHADNSMAGNYTQHIDDERLSRVVNHVRAWLFKKEEA